jgi:hypothetical protein
MKEDALLRVTLPYEVEDEALLRAAVSPEH